MYQQRKNVDYDYTPCPLYEWKITYKIFGPKKQYSF